jgi:adenosylmethionine---8-amino-7-oxononanoate aminotransferase
MKDYKTFKPLEVAKARGSYIELKDGTKIIDAISSWWCKSLGHSHPRLKAAIIKQMDKFEHVIAANTINDTIALLSEKLTGLSPTLKKVFYSGDGSCAVEIAMKMSLHSRVNRNDFKRKKFISLMNGYHGETFATLSISDLGIYRAPYSGILFESILIPHVPYVNHVNEALWENCSVIWQDVEKFLELHGEDATAIILEPIVQGAAGMKIYSADFLSRLKNWCVHHNVHLIADEIMTGIGRTGKMLACEHACIEPDFLCLSKGLTSGWLPFSAVLTTDDIYDIFYDDYASGKSFLHSNTYSCNPLGAAIAVEVLNIIKEEKLCERANLLGEVMLSMMEEISLTSNRIENIRGIGAIVAADLISTGNNNPRFGFEVYKKAVSLGALLRCIGNTVYWLPPLNIGIDTLEQLQYITSKAIVDGYTESVKL